MSSYQGNIIIKNPATPTGPSPTGSAPGIWTLSEAMAFIKQGVWPTANYIVPDTYFPYVTMLLNSTAINAAQNSTFIDSSTNNLSITRNGNATQGSVSPYSANWSNYFDGVGDFLSISDNTAFDFGSGDFTIEAWIYLTAYNPTFASQIFGAHNYGTSADYIFQINTTGKLSFQIGSGSPIVVSTSSVSLNTWTHVAIVRSGTSLTPYINGVNAGGGATSSSSVDAGRNLTIGSDATGNTGASLSGYISNLRVVKGTAVYTSAFTPPTSPLTAISGTSLLTCADNRFRDGSTNNFTITRTGDVRVSSFSRFSPSLPYSAATIGGSLYTDGSGDYLLTSSSNALGFGSGDFTFECWLYPITYPNDSYMLSTGSTTTNNNISLEIRNAQVAAHLYISGSHSDVQFTDLQPRLYAWNHLAISRVSGVLYGFLNGVRSSVTQSLSASFGSSGLMSISESGYSGYVSDVRISNGTAVYSGSTYTVPTAPLASTASTALLLKFTNAGIYDAAEINNMETVSNAQVSTSVSKFGGSSVFFNGTGGFLDIPSASSKESAFGTGDFTVEMWLYFNSVSGSPTIITFNNFGSGDGFFLNVESSAIGIRADGGTPIRANTTVTTGVWYHVAVTRSSGTLRLFQNGVNVGSTTWTTNCTAGLLRIGQPKDTTGSTYALSGYMDELRITKGYARYTANFTPPTQAFPTL